MNLLWDNPDGATRGGIIVVHGFARSAQHMSGIAGALAARGFLVARPSISSFTPRRSLHDARWLDDLGVQVIDRVRERVADQPIIGIGHSAGAAVVAGWSDALAGLVLLDPVDRHGRIRRYADSHADSDSDSDARVITADPSACNRHGRAVHALVDTGCVHPGRSWMHIEQTSHADPERVPASLLATDVPPGELIVDWVCGRGGTPQRVVLWGETIVGFVDELVAQSP